MNVIGKLKAYFGVEDYQDEDEEYEEEGEQVEEFNSPAPSPVADRRERAVEDKKVVNINAGSQLKVVLMRPESYSRDAESIADHLKCGRAVVVNFERTVGAEARRLLDYLLGVAYALGGSAQRIAEKAFLITPYNVDVESNDFLYDAENA